jgi:hypothetical protein
LEERKMVEQIEGCFVCLQNCFLATLAHV